MNLSCGMLRMKMTGSAMMNSCIMHGSYSLKMEKEDKDFKRLV